MGELINKNNDISINANILTKKEGNLYVAHCLEFDIVATGDTADQAQRDCVSLVCAQIEYAFAHDNLDNLYHSAPAEVWAELGGPEIRIRRLVPDPAYSIAHRLRATAWRCNWDSQTVLTIANEIESVTYAATDGAS